MDDKQQNNPAEIDLFYFFRPLGKVLKKAGDAVAYGFRKLYRNQFLMAAIVIVITGAGYAMRYLVPPAYETQGIFVSHILPAKYCSMQLQNLNKLKGAKNIHLLAQLLRVDTGIAADIISIGLKPMKDTFVLEKKDTVLSLFQISLVLKEIKNLDTIQSALITYLENNEYAIKRKEAKRKSLQALKKSLDAKLESLDSLKKIVNSSIIPRSEGKGIILGEPVDPISVYQAEVAYYKEQLYIDQALATIDNIEVIQPFLKINQFNYPGYNRIMLRFFISGIIIAALVALVFGKKPR